MFEAIEEEDRVVERDEGLPPALLGSCNDRAKQLHNSPSGIFSSNGQIIFVHCIYIASFSLFVIPLKHFKCF